LVIGYGFVMWFQSYDFFHDCCLPLWTSFIHWWILLILVSAQLPNIYFKLFMEPFPNCVLILIHLCHLLKSLFLSWTIFTRNWIKCLVQGGEVGTIFYQSYFLSFLKGSALHLIISNAQFLLIPGRRVHMLLNMSVGSMLPYIQCLDSWHFEGTLDDPYEEVI
jgi:hypothetical protein